MSRHSLIGRIVGTRAQSGGRSWYWVRVIDVALSGGFLFVGRGVGFGKPRWVKASECKTKSATCQHLLEAFVQSKGAQS